jgi:hypothetical protein
MRRWMLAIIALLAVSVVVVREQSQAEDPLQA